MFNRWTIANMNKEIKKDILDELSENEINCIQNEFDIILNKIDIIPTDYKGRVVIVMENIIFLGTYNNTGKSICLDNSFSIFRENGLAFTCHPRRVFPNFDKGFLYSVSLA